jgi:hypothetical protein
MLAAGASAEPPAPRDWEIELTPYGWLPALDAAVETRRQGTEHFEVGIDDVLEKLDLAAMGRVSARWRRWLLVVDGVWTTLEQEDAFRRGPLRVDSDARMTLALVQALGGLRVVSRPGGLFGTAAPGDERVFGFDVLAGLNYTYVSASFELERDPVGPGAGNDRHFGSTKDWVAPAVGVRLHNDFTSRLRLETLASVGGFGVGDAPDHSWVLTALLSYRFTEHWVASLGHRTITADGNAGEIRMHGPMVGIGYRF